MGALVPAAAGAVGVPSLTGACAEGPAPPVADAAAFGVLPPEVSTAALTAASTSTLSPR